MAKASSDASTAVAPGAPEIELGTFTPNVGDGPKLEKAATDTASVAEWPRWVCLSAFARLGVSANLGEM